MICSFPAVLLAGSPHSQFQKQRGSSLCQKNPHKSPAMLLSWQGSPCSWETRTSFLNSFSAEGLSRVLQSHQTFRSEHNGDGSGKDRKRRRKRRLAVVTSRAPHPKRSADRGHGAQGPLLCDAEEPRYGLRCAPAHMAKPWPPEPLNVTVSGDRTLIEVRRLK